MPKKTRFGFFVLLLTLLFLLAGCIESQKTDFLGQSFGAVDNGEKAGIESGGSQLDYLVCSVSRHDYIGVGRAQGERTWYCSPPDIPCPCNSQSECQAYCDDYCRTTYLPPARAEALSNCLSNRPDLSFTCPDDCSKVTNFITQCGKGYLDGITVYAFYNPVRVNCMCDATALTPEILLYGCVETKPSIWEQYRNRGLE